MAQLLAQLRPQDFFLLGVLATLWLQARANRARGERIGNVEQTAKATEAQIATLITLVQGMDARSRLSETPRSEARREG